MEPGANRPHPRSDVPEHPWRPHSRGGGDGRNYLDFWVHWPDRLSAKHGDDGAGSLAD